MVYIKVVSRDAWKAQPALKRSPLIFPVRSVVFRYTETEKCLTEFECCKLMRGFQQAAFTKGLEDIPYNFVIGGDLSVYEARGWDNKMFQRKLVIAYIAGSADTDQRVQDMSDLAYQFIKLNDNKVKLLVSPDLADQENPMAGEGFVGGNFSTSPDFQTV